MQPVNVKEEAHRLVDELPQDATWEDLMYKIYVRQAIEAGLEDSEAGRVSVIPASRLQPDAHLKDNHRFA